MTTVPDAPRCEHCDEPRVWAWSTTQNRYLLRACDCQRPKPDTPDRTTARAGLAAARDALKERAQ